MRHFLVGAALAIFLASVCDAEVRKWTDASGKHSVQATLVEFKDGEVVLRRTDGRTVSVPLEKLSPADQQYVKQQAAKGPAAQEKPEAPGAGKEEPGKPVWTMDLAKMRVPEGKVTGRIHGQDFVLDAAELEGSLLTLRQGKDFFPELALKIFLFLKDESVEGKTFRVTPDSKFGNPHLHVQWRAKKGEGVPETEIVMDNYAMILEFDRLTEGKIPGRIYACLSDKSRSVVAGTFTIGAADLGAAGAEISGKITARGSTRGLWVSVGCLGKNPEGKLEDPSVGFELEDSGGSATCLSWKPRNTTLAWDGKAGTHKHVNRPPGRYLVYLRGRARGDDTKPEGYYDWKWVEIKDEKAKLIVDLTIDPSTLGTVEVTVHGSTTESSVTYVPLDENGQLPLPEAPRYLWGSSSAKLEGGKAVIRGLREGKYQVALGPWQPATHFPSAKADVEVKRGRTTKVELTVPPAAPAPKAPTATKKQVTASGAPDLQVGQIYLKEVQEGTLTEGYMRALVKNSGGTRATGFSVVFFVDGQRVSTFQGMNLDPGEEREASAPKLPPGTHVVKVVVDADNTNRESDETNNSKEATLSSTQVAPKPSPTGEIPAPQLVLTGTDRRVTGGNTWVEYQLAIANWSAFPEAWLRDSQPELQIYAEDGKYIYGFARRSRPEALRQFWFAVEEGKTPPAKVYVVLRDQKSKKTYKSNLVSTSQP